MKRTTKVTAVTAAMLAGGLAAWFFVLLRSIEFPALDIRAGDLDPDGDD